MQAEMISKLKKKSTNSTIKAKKVIPVEFKPPVMDYEGNIKFTFNQPLLLPPFVAGGVSDGRLL